MAGFSFSSFFAAAKAKAGAGFSPFFSPSFAPKPAADTAGFFSIISFSSFSKSALSRNRHFRLASRFAAFTIFSPRATFFSHSVVVLITKGSSGLSITKRVDGILMDTAFNRDGCNTGHTRPVFFSSFFSSSFVTSFFSFTTSSFFSTSFSSSFSSFSTTCFRTGTASTPFSLSHSISPTFSASFFSFFITTTPGTQLLFLLTLSPTLTPFNRDSSDVSGDAWCREPTGLILCLVLKEIGCEPFAHSVGTSRSISGFPIPSSILTTPHFSPADSRCFSLLSTSSLACSASVATTAGRLVDTVSNTLSVSLIWSRVKRGLNASSV